MGRGSTTPGKSTGGTWTLYHGSPNANITQFDESLMGRNTSSGEHFIFFTDDKTFADEFSYERLPGSSMFYNKRGNKGAVYSSEVTMKKPLDFRNLSDKDMDNLIKLDIIGDLTKDKIKYLLSGNEHQSLKARINLNNIKNYGYDGFIAKVDIRGKALEYAVVSSKQIKNIKKAR